MTREEFLDQLYKATTSHLESDSTENLVDVILAKAEELGMVPPLTDNPNYQGGWNVHTHPAYVHAWDKKKD